MIEPVGSDPDLRNFTALSSVSHSMKSQVGTCYEVSYILSLKYVDVLISSTCDYDLIWK